MSYYIGNSTTINVPYTVTTVGTTQANTWQWSPYAATTYPIASVPISYSPPEPDTPEAWLRRRVREMCELAKAA